MSDTVLMLSSSGYTDDLICAYAKDEEGLRRLAANYWVDFMYGDLDKIDIEIDMESKRMTIIEHDPDDEWKHTYVIHEIPLEKPVI